MSSARAQGLPANDLPSYYSQFGADETEVINTNWSSAAGTGVIGNTGCAAMPGCGAIGGGCTSCAGSGCGGCNGGCYSPFSFYGYQTADYVTNVTLPGRVQFNPFGFSFLNNLSPNDAYFGVPQYFATNGLSSSITNFLPVAGAGGTSLPLLPSTTLTNTVTNVLPGGVTDFLSGLINGGQPGTISVAPAFQDDWQYQTAGGAYYQLPLGENVSFTAGLNYYQVLHNQVKSFDFQSPSASGILGVRLTDRLVTSTNYQYQYNLLRGQTFGNVNLIGQNAFYVLNDRWMLQAGGQYTQSAFQAAPFFSSAAATGNLGALRFLGSNRTSYLIGGYNYGKSDAANNGFSYYANSVYLGGRWLFGPTSQNDLLLFSSLSLYNFRNPDPVQTGAVRNDHNALYSARLARWITPNASLFGQYTFANNNSNIVRQDFDSNYFSVGGLFLR